MSLEYDIYLREHKQNVANAFHWIEKNLPELINGDVNYEGYICEWHDSSKNDMEK